MVGPESASPNLLSKSFGRAVTVRSSHGLNFLGVASAAAGLRSGTTQERQLAGSLSSSDRARAAVGTKRLWQAGELTLLGQNASRAAMTGCAQQVHASPSRTSSFLQAGSAAGRQRLRQAGVLTPQAVGSRQVAGQKSNCTPKTTPKGCAPWGGLRRS